MAMAKNTDSKITGEKIRYKILFLMPVIVFFAVFARLYYLQVIKYREYIETSLAERVKETPIKAERGEVYMKDGTEGVVPVIMNERVWDLYIDPKYSMSFGESNKKKIQETLDSVIGEENMKYSWSEVWGDKNSQYKLLATGINYDAAIKIKKGNLVGVGLNPGTRRVFPSGTLASQLLGYMNMNGQGDGIEGSPYLKERLSGKDGVLKAVIDVNNIPLSIGDEHTEVPAVDGDDIILTVDINIQRKVESILANKVDNDERVSTASAVVMDPLTGKVLAMANYPNFDPANYGKADPDTLKNRVLTGLYEPASVIKPFTYAVALNEGKISLDGTYVNTGSTEVDGIKIDNARGTSQYKGEISFQKAINHSLNTGSVEVLRRIGGGSITKDARQTMYSYFTESFGLGRPTGIELYEEGGIIAKPDSNSGPAVQYSNMTFGQGMSVTMMQVATGFSSLVNGGNYIEPTLIEGVLNEQGNIVSSEDNVAVRSTLTADTSVEVRKMLMEVRKVNGGYADPKGYNIGVKSGTAETIDPETGKYIRDETNASALGFGGTAGEDAMPAYVIMVRLDGNHSLLWGSSDAVPVFTEISNYLIDYLRIPPSL